MDVSLITSSYRSENFLPEYLSHADRVAREVAAAGLALEIIFVANDATPTEHDLIEGFITRADIYTARVMYVERETLYASWDRGVEAATGKVIGFWNVDDIRTAEGIVEGYALAQAGAEVIYFPLIQDIQNVWYGIPDRRYQTYIKAAEYDRDRFQREPLAGTFFMFTPEIFERVGGFDVRFHVLGDFDWWIRAADQTDFKAGKSTAGYWIKHGENLTAGIRGKLERQVIFLRYRQYDLLQYGQWNPRTLRELWRQWEADSPVPPPEVAEKLWGTQAIAAWDAGSWQRKVKDVLEFPKTLLRLGINYTNTRRYFYRLGLVKDRLP